MRAHLGAALVLAIVAGPAPEAEAGWFKDRVRDVKKIVGKVPQVPLPIKPQLDIVLGTPPKQAFKDFVQGNGKNIGTVANTSRVLTNAVDRPLSNFSQAVGGKYGTIAYELLTGSQRLQNEFVFTAANGAANLLQGQDPLAALALPLAAAIRDARSKFDAQAKPLPPEVIELLAPVVPMPLLQRARYARGDLKISLPSVINAGQKMFAGVDHAVTVDDIIVFSKVPGADSEADLVWWAHEIHHVHQYMQWGVDQFAFNYLKHSGRVESEAEHAAEFVRSYLRQLPTSTAIQPQAALPKVRMYRTAAIATPLGSTQVFVEAPATQLGGPPGGRVATDRCMVTGEDLLIMSDNTIVSLMRGGDAVGARLPPLDPRCAFDLLSHGSGRRFCVARPSGHVLDASLFVLGQCYRCSPATPCQ